MLFLSFLSFCAAALILPNTPERAAYVFEMMEAERHEHRDGGYERHGRRDGGYERHGRRDGGYERRELESQIDFFSGQLTTIRETIRDMTGQKEAMITRLLTLIRAVSDLNLALTKETTKALLERQKREESALKTVWRFFVGRSVDVDSSAIMTLTSDVEAFRQYINTVFTARLEAERRREETLSNNIEIYEQTLIDIANARARNLRRDYGI